MKKYEGTPVLTIRSTGDMFVGMNLTRIWRGAHRTGIILKYKLKIVGKGTPSLFYLSWRIRLASLRRAITLIYLAVHTTVMMLVPLPAQAAEPVVDVVEPYLPVVVYKAGEFTITESKLNTPQLGMSKYDEQVKARQEEIRRRELDKRKQASAQGIIIRPIPIALSDLQIRAKGLTDESFGPGHYDALHSLIQQESGWNPWAINSRSGAYGLGQALPASKMIDYGTDWQNNPDTQLRWLMGYIKARYGTPNNAWNFWLQHRWY